MLETAASTDRAALTREFLADRTAELREISRFLHDTISQDLVQLSFKASELRSYAVRDSSSLADADSALEIVDRCCRDKIGRASCRERV